MPAPVHPVDDPAHFAHHLGPDAVARQDQQLFIGGSITLPTSWQPGLRLRPLGLECVDLRGALHGLADIVETVEQQVLAERVDAERDLLAVRPDHHLPRQVHGDPRIAAHLRVFHQLVADGARQLDRQDAVLEAVVVEDVGEARRDHAADAEIQQRPGRMFARRAAAEILVRDQDLGVPVRLRVQHEVRPLGALTVVAQRVEQVDAKAGALDRLEEARGDDLVGIDVGERQRRRDRRSAW